MANGRGHEIGRALEIYPMVILWKIEIEFCMVTSV